MAYHKELRSLLRALDRRIRARVTARLPALVAEVQRSVPRLDDAEAVADETTATFRELRAELESLTSSRQVDELLKRIGTAVERQQRGQFARQLRERGVVQTIDVLGTELWLQEQLALFARVNASAIQKMAGEHIDAVEGIVLRGLQSGARSAEIARQIQARTKVSQSRAALIATDQVARLQGQMNRLRQRSAGITTYVWSTSQDERVRASHARLNGREFNWDEPPVVNGQGRRAHPGGDIRCRCTAIPVIDSLMEVGE